MIINLPKQLEKDLIDFIKLNKIDDIDEFILSCFRNGYYIAKYGNSPKENFNSENKPFKIVNYDREESFVEGVDGKEKKGRKTGKKSAEEKESSIPKEESEEIIKPKKTIRIIKS